MLHPRILTAIPVYNERATVGPVLDAVRKVVVPDIGPILVVDDGSTDGTSECLVHEPQVQVLRHSRNRGYGAAIHSAIRYAIRYEFDVLVTMDCDGQHEPSRIPVLLEALVSGVDLVSGSRYLKDFRQDTPAPGDRRAINQQITQEINQRFGLQLTDAFCGFKAYRVSRLTELHLTEPSWGMPLQLWVQAARQGWQIREVGVPRLYLDPNRAFGGVLNQPEERLAYYRRIIDAAAAEPWLCQPNARHEFCPDAL